jgi:hypothetical protein
LKPINALYQGGSLQDEPISVLSTVRVTTDHLFCANLLQTSLLALALMQHSARD